MICDDLDNNIEPLLSHIRYGNPSNISSSLLDKYSSNLFISYHLPPPHVTITRR